MSKKDLEIFAKSSGVTLVDHTIHVIKALDSILKEVERVDPDFLSGPMYKNVLYLAALFHDIGKVHPVFQHNIIKKMDSESNQMNWINFSELLKWMNSLEGLHSVVSTLLVCPSLIEDVLLRNQNNVNERTKKHVLSLFYSTVAFHHWRHSMYGTNEIREEARRLGHLLVNKSQISAYSNKHLIEVASEVIKKTIDKIGNEQVFNNPIDFIQNLNKYCHNYFEFQDLAEHFCNCGWITDFIYAKSRDEQYDIFLFPPQNFLLPKNIQQAKDEELMKKRTLFAGWLMKADRFASNVESLKEGDGRYTHAEEWFENKSSPDILDNLAKNIGKKKDDLWQQKVLNELKDAENIILIAPTGSGKTEFAFAFGINKCKRKTIFTLPLQAAVNKMYERALKIVDNLDSSQDKTVEKIIEGDTKSVLLHSMASYRLYELLSAPQKKSITVDEEGEIENFTRLAKFLGKPVIIATGDQIFPSVLKYPGYEMTYATLAISTLVVDEVQAYDPIAMAIVLQGLIDTVLHGGRFLLMTATLPPFFVQELKEVLDKEGKADKTVIVNLYCNRWIKLSDWSKEDKYFKKGYVCIKGGNLPVNPNLVRHKIALIKGDLLDDSVIDEIKKFATLDNGKRVLVIVNTVKRAKELYEKLRQSQNNFSVELLHSRLTLKERAEKESKITSEKMLYNQPKNDWEKNKKMGVILIATQVVEASLDINADYLFTDFAPADSLIQRMGRVNRDIRPDRKCCQREPNVFIYLDWKEEVIELQDSSSGKRSGKKKEQKQTVIIPTDFASNRVYDKGLLALTLYHLLRIVRKECELKTESLSLIKEQCEKSVCKEIHCCKGLELSEGQKLMWLSEIFSNPNFVNTSYYEEFQNAIDLLRSLWTAEKAIEAQEVFRRVLTVPIILIKDKENIDKTSKPDYDQNGIEFDKIKQKLEELLEKDNLTYITFLREFYSEFVINDYRRRDKQYKSLVSTAVFAELEDKINSERDRNRRKKYKKNIKRLRKWCKEIYQMI